MPFNLRGTGTIPDGSITAAKLADNAVIESKIAADAVTTAKIANDAVSVAKVAGEIGIQHFLGFEGSLPHTGTTETTVAEFNFTKSSTVTEAWRTLGYAITLVSNDSGNVVTLKTYIDGVEYATDGTSSTTPVLLEEPVIDISGLTNGNHLVEFKITNSQVTGIGTISKLDAYLGKKPV